jgi:hypothetical protein
VTKKTLISLTVVVDLFVLLLHRVDLQQLGSALVDVHIGLLAVGLIAQLIIMWIKSFDGQELSRGQEPSGGHGLCYRGLCSDGPHVSWGSWLFSAAH